MQQKNATHYPWLDLVRFIAASSVLLCHCRTQFFVDYSSLPAAQHNPVVSFSFFVTRLGFESVLVFFVLSGFLVGGKAIKRLSEGSFRAKDYAIDRFARIMLPLVGSLLLFIAISLYCRITLDPIAIIGSLLSVQGIMTPRAFDVLWSLSYEVWFYILMFAIGVMWSYKSVTDNKSKMLLGGILFVLSLLVFTKLKASYLYVWMMSAFIFVTFTPPKNTKSYKSICYLSLLLSSVLIVLLQLTSGSHYFKSIIPGDSDLIRSILTILFGGAFSIFVRTAILFPPTSSLWIRINHIGSKLAAFSYTLYLTHRPVFTLLSYLGAPKSPSLTMTSIGLFVCWVAVAMVVAYVFYCLFERHTQLFKHFLKKVVNKL